MTNITSPTNSQLLRLVDEKNFLELAIGEQLDDAYPRPGDAEMRVRAQCEGPGGKFSADAVAWVTGEALVSFCTELLDFEKTKSGEATLMGMAPGEFELRVYQAGRTGRLAVEVFIARRQQRQEARITFPFDPAQLTPAAAVDWVRAHAE